MAKANVTVVMEDTVTVLVTKIGSKDVKNVGIEIPTKCEDLRQAVAQGLLNAGIDGKLGDLGLSLNGKPTPDNQTVEAKEDDRVVVSKKAMKGGK